VANGLIVTERRGLIGAQDADRYVNDLEQLLLSVIESRTDIVTLREATELARAYPLMPYDSVYLALAKKEGIALATDRNCELQRFKLVSKSSAGFVR
jgi:predicted nucleic acid-binding protein